MWSIGRTTARETVTTHIIYKLNSKKKKERERERSQEIDRETNTIENKDSLV